MLLGSKHLQILFFDCHLFFGYIDYRFSPLIYWVAFHNVEI